MIELWLTVKSIKENRNFLQKDSILLELFIKLFNIIIQVKCYLSIKFNFFILKSCKIYFLIVFLKKCFLFTFYSKIYFAFSSPHNCFNTNIVVLTINGKRSGQLTNQLKRRTISL